MDELGMAQIGHDADLLADGLLIECVGRIDKLGGKRVARSPFSATMNHAEGTTGILLLKSYNNRVITYTPISSWIS